MQLVIRKNTLEINEYECLPNFELKFKFLENLRKPLTLKSTRKRIDIDFAIHRAISVKYNVEFTRQAVNFFYNSQWNSSSLRLSLLSMIVHLIWRY